MIGPDTSGYRVWPLPPGHSTYAALQSEKAVTAYSKSKQLPPLQFAQWPHRLWFYPIIVHDQDHVIPGVIIAEGLGVCTRRIGMCMAIGLQQAAWQQPILIQHTQPVWEPSLTRQSRLARVFSFFTKGSVNVIILIRFLYQSEGRGRLARVFGAGALPGRAAGIGASLGYPASAIGWGGLLLPVARGFTAIRGRFMGRGAGPGRGHGVGTAGYILGTHLLLVINHALSTSAPPSSLRMRCTPDVHKGVRGTYTHGVQT